MPDNRSHMNRLVLLQTPAHAASEIKRLMRAVRNDDMPVDEALLHREIDPDARAALLDYGAVFEELVSMWSTRRKRRGREHAEHRTWDAQRRACQSTLTFADLIAAAHLSISLWRKARR